MINKYDFYIPVIQIRRGNKDNLGLISLIFSFHLIHLVETVLMRGHNKCFPSEIRKNIFEFS